MNDENQINENIKNSRNMNVCHDNCSICLDKLNIGYITLECNHKFHTKCLGQLLEYNSQCPYCRNNISLVDNSGEDANNLDLSNFHMLSIANTYDDIKKSSRYYNENNTFIYQKNNMFCLYLREDIVN
jgi:hypothetical protein